MSSASSSLSWLVNFCSSAKTVTMKFSSILIELLICCYWYCDARGETTHQPTHSFIVIHIYMYTRRDDDDDDGCAHCRALEADISEPGRQAGRQVSTELESIQKRNNPPLSLPILWGTTILRECRSQSHSVSNVCSAISISSIIISLSPSHSRTVVPGRSVYYYYDGDDMREI